MNTRTIDLHALTTSEYDAEVQRRLRARSRVARIAASIAGHPIVWFFAAEAVVITLAVLARTTTSEDPWGEKAWAEVAEMEAEK